MNPPRRYQRSLRAIFVLLFFALCLLAYTRIMARWGHTSPPALLPAAQQADLIVIHKSERTLTLMRHGVPLANYHVSLGKNADAGPKQREGDKRTPQGHYFIDSRNSHSRFSLSLHISYPDKNDINAAKSAGYSPGENIMIHGLPNGWAGLNPLLQLIDWTNGCIAVTNTEMDDIWSRVSTGTPVEIEP